MAFAAGIHCWPRHVSLKSSDCQGIAVRSASPPKFFSAKSSVWLGNSLSWSAPRCPNHSGLAKLAAQPYARWNPFGGGKWLGGPELIERSDGVLVDVEELRELLHAANPSAQGGRVYDAPRVKKLLFNSLAVMAVYIKESSTGVGASSGGREKLVACAWAHGDAGLTATISHVVVHPAYQRQGIGSRVVKRLLRELRRIQVEDIGLVAESQFIPFFRANGFEDDRMGSTVMTYARGAEPPPPLQLPLKITWPA